MSTDTATHVLTDQGVPIGWSIIADRPELGYLADPDASRPATEAELAATEAAAYAEFAAAMAANAAIGTAPRGPWPVAKAAVTAPEPEAEPEPEPGAIHCDCQDDAPIAEDPEPGELALLNEAYHAASADEPAAPPPPAPGPIAQMAAEANGLGELDKAQEVAFTAFSGAFDADPEGDGDRAQPDATAQIEAVGDATEVTPAVTEATS